MKMYLEQKTLYSVILIKKTVHLTKKGQLNEI